MQNALLGVSAHGVLPRCFPSGQSKSRRGINPLIFWQEWRDSNPQPPVLETGALAIELHSWGAP
jgi:hypothetical protein